ncbi:MAG: cyclic nucleotide-binding domain-containing protein [Acidimicrobiales bacterium]
MTNATTVSITEASAAATTDHWWEAVCGPLPRRVGRRLSHVGTDFVYVPGAVIVAEGSRAERFSVILHGEVEVVVDGAVVATLGPGEFFGEVALLYSRPAAPAAAPDALPRTATVRTTMATRVRELDRAELMTLMDAAPAAASRISRRAIGRLAVMKA